MDRRLRYIICLLSAAACIVSSCIDKDLDIGLERIPENAIRVGGIDANEMLLSVNTRANTDAEKVSWLVQPLKNGLDITYGLYGAEVAHEDVAILKLVNESSNPAEYTFKYRADRKNTVGDGNDAIWYNNGYHYFQGVHVPERIRYISDNISDVEGSSKAPGLTSDQHNDIASGTDAELGNYTLLSHYLGMPANYRLTATVERIVLPFRHRLARVVAFVLIDPELHTTLKGYKKDASGAATTAEDPTTTSFRFSNVQVLQGVRDVEGTDGHHILTPKWKEARKVIPHFDGEKGSYSYSKQEQYDEDFKYYYKDEDGSIKDLYPTSSGWSSAHNAANHNGYTEVNYGKVPVYDIIVRPTYTNTDNVMYDEEGYTVGTSTSKTNLANQTNKIVFEIELENGLQYQKTFEFDLNANYQTVVYLRINREHVDYNASGSELWVESRNSDGWFGVNNENGNTLSKAGSSWQRAYTSVVSFNSETGTYTSDNILYQNGVTDGQFYNADNNDNDNAQYYTADYDAQWVEKFLQAYKIGDAKGAHHGDYFVLKKDITIDARLIPENFVFTGHLDAQDHTISLKEGSTGQQVYKDAVNITDPLFTRTGTGIDNWAYSGWAIPTLYVKHVTPAVLWQEEELINADGVWYKKGTVQWKETEYIKYTQTECDKINPQHLTTYNKPVYYTQEEIDAAKAIIEAEDYKKGSNPDAEQTAAKTVDDIKEYTPIEPEQEGYVDTYEEGYPITTDTVKEIIDAHWDVSGGEPHKPGDIKEPEVISYPEATAETTPAYPTTLEELKQNEYYINQSGDRFECPALLYQTSHISPSYLFHGLDGTYTTTQEEAANPYAAGVVWEANVHKETNQATVWVPTSGYRAELLNTVMAWPYTLFRAEASITGNVQNSFNMNSDGTKTAVTHTPNIPQYQ